MEFFVYVKGMCKGNPGKGAFSYVVYDLENTIWYEGKGVFKDTTNNQMELFAVIESVRKIRDNYKNKCFINFYSDSSYLVNCMKERWYEKWERNGWKNNKGEDVLNREFWQILIGLLKDHESSFFKTTKKEKRHKK